MTEPDFAFQKKLGVHESICDNPFNMCDLIGKLIFYMKENNQLNGVSCEFFRLDFRKPYFDEQMQFPIGSFILDFKWGSKKELEKKND